MGDGGGKEETGSEWKDGERLLSSRANGEVQ